MNMTEARRKMNEALKEWTIPFLRECGFTGSLPHFRRRMANRIDLLTFQFDKWGGGFVVEIAQCPSEGITMFWGEKIAPNKVTAHDANDRLRLGAIPPAEDYWFRYDDASPRIFRELAAKVAQLVHDQAEDWWGKKAEQGAAPDG